MIHQLIFANPKPGMEVLDFQNYWLNIHAVKYASKIPQIVRYRINKVRTIDDEKPLFNGVGEIWLRNEAEQLESLQSKEFLQGARIDEPNWAAFWETIALDTTAVEIKEHHHLDQQVIKLVLLVKRKEGTPLELFRYYSGNSHSKLVCDFFRVIGYTQCYTVDAAYHNGEPRFDAVYQLWFENSDSLQSTLQSNYYKNELLTDLDKFVEMKYFFKLICEEHWIIGPEYRSYHNA